MKSKILIAIILLVGIVSLYKTSDLQQLNSEEIFLTKEGLENYRSFLKKSPHLDFLILKSPTGELKKESIQKKCSECLILGPKDNIDSQQAPFKLADSNHDIFIVISDMGDMILKAMALEYKKLSPNLSLAGLPYTNSQLDEHSKTIQEVLFPTMFVFSLIMLVVIFMSLRMAALIFVPALTSALVSLYIIKLIDGHINMLTSIIPLLCFTLSMIQALHIAFAYRETKDLQKAIKLKAIPIILTVLTTCIGFASLAIAPLWVIGKFGVLSAILIFISSLLTISWQWATARYLPQEIKPLFTERLTAHSLFKNSMRVRFLIPTLILFFISGAWGLNNIRTLTDATQYFSKESGIREEMIQINSNYVGIPIAEIVFSNYHEQDLETLKKFETLEIIIQKEAPSIQVLSPVALLKTSNYKYTSKYELPKFDLASRTLMSQWPKQFKKIYNEEIPYRITLLSSPIENKNYFHLLTKLKRVLGQSKLGPYEINGIYHNLMNAQEKMIQVLSKSLLLTAFIICLLAFVYFRSPRVFFLFLIVNFAPVSLALFIMKSLNFSLNIATVMTFSISLGIVVDSTFHIVHALHSKEISWKEYLSHTLSPIIFGTFTLIFSFCLFGFQDFLPIKQFGLTLAIILTIGLFCDLFILPTLFTKNHSLEKYFSSKKNSL